MQNLLYFISRYYAFFVFLILEIISYNLIIGNNMPQRKIHEHSIAVWTAVVDDKISVIKNYFKLQQIADSLVRENARLKGELLNIKASLKDSLIPKIRRDSMYEMVGARVLSNTLYERHNTFIINRGTLHGIQAGMGAMTNNGVAGIVRNSNEHYSIVMSLINPSIRISAKMKHYPFFGTLHWQGGDLQMLDLYDIPKYAEIHKGDTIVTSGYSTIFPPDIPLGTIEKFHINQGSDVYNIKVRLFSRMPNLKYVYVIRRKGLEEIEALKNEHTL